MAYDIEDVKAIFAKAEVVLDKDDVWTVQKTPVVKHQALERLAAALKISFSVPEVLRREADEAVLMVVGEVEDGRTEWSIGEAKVVLLKDSGLTNSYGKPIYEAPSGAMGNYQITPKQAAYPYAMAEKRAKDRVILKLARLNGVYSEEEADEFKAGSPPAPTSSIAPGTRASEAYLNAADAILSSDKYTALEVHKWWNDSKPDREKAKLADAQVVALKERTTARISELKQKELENV